MSRWQQDVWIVGSDFVHERIEAEHRIDSKTNTVQAIIYGTRDILDLRTILDRRMTHYMLKNYKVLYGVYRRAIRCAQMLVGLYGEPGTNYKVKLAGVSLGGPIAALTAALLHSNYGWQVETVKLYGPMIGFNKDLRNYLVREFNVKAYTNGNDAVPEAKFPWEFWLHQFKLIPFSPRRGLRFRQYCLWLWDINLKRGDHTYYPKAVHELKEEWNE